MRLCVCGLFVLCCVSSFMKLCVCVFCPYFWLYVCVLRLGVRVFILSPSEVFSLPAPPPPPPSPASITPTFFSITLNFFSNYPDFLPNYPDVLINYPVAILNHPDVLLNYPMFSSITPMLFSNTPTSLPNYPDVLPSFLPSITVMLDGGHNDAMGKRTMRGGAIGAAIAWRPTSTADWARYCIHDHI